MSRKNSSFARVMATLADSIAATAASLWPRSTASIEAHRLIADGYPAKQVCDVYFLVSFDGSVPDGVLATMRSAGFAVREQGGSPGGFVTVRARVRLGAYSLSMAAARLDRIAESFDGFSTVIGAARPTNDDAARAVRVPSRSVAAI
jgi:hypothetical protein